MRVNMLVTIDVRAKTIDEARIAIRRALIEIGEDSQGDRSGEARGVETALMDAVDVATEGSVSFPTPDDIERERVAAIDTDVRALLDKIKSSLLKGEKTLPCSVGDAFFRKEVERRVSASGWDVRFEEARDGENRVTVTPRKASS